MLTDIHARYMAERAQREQLKRSVILRSAPAVEAIARLSAASAGLDLHRLEYVRRLALAGRIGG